MNDIAGDYDRAAQAYADHFFHELDDKPLDRRLLDFFIDQVRGRGRVADVGCGPGHVARLLHQRGLDAVGIDLSPQMIEVARQLSPGVPFETGSMLSLPHADRWFAGITAFYAIVHFTPDEVRAAFEQLFRVLMPGAPLLLAFHLGDQRLHVDELLGVQVSLDFVFFPRSVIEPALRAAGFEIDWWTERRAYPSEHPSTRAYVFARRPAA